VVNGIPTRRRKRFSGQGDLHVYFCHGIFAQLIVLTNHVVEGHSHCRLQVLIRALRQDDERALRKRYPHVLVVFLIMIGLRNLKKKSRIQDGSIIGIFFYRFGRRDRVR
jgi:3-methyladenine DNA glycosylase Mpg